MTKSSTTQSEALTAKLMVDPDYQGAVVKNSATCLPGSVHDDFWRTICFEIIPDYRQLAASNGWISRGSRAAARVAAFAWTAHRTQRYRSSAMAIPLSPATE